MLDDKVVEDEEVEGMEAAVGVVRGVDVELGVTGDSEMMLGRNAPLFVVVPSVERREVTARVVAETATESVTSLPDEDAGEVGRVGAAKVMAVRDTDDVVSNDEYEAVGDIWCAQNRNERVANRSNAEKFPKKQRASIFH